MYSTKDFKFESEAEATEFAKTERENKCPSEDKYVVGPLFMDEEEIFKDTSLSHMISKKSKWWQVTIETYR